MFKLYGYRQPLALLALFLQFILSGYRNGQRSIGDLVNKLYRKLS
jgi:hypothetical protein